MPDAKGACAPTPEQPNAPQSGRTDVDLTCGQSDILGSSRRMIWLGEQECFSWGVTAWIALAAGVLAGWVARVLTRNAVPRSS